MTFQVKEVTPVEEKSVQEVEANLLNKHSEEQQVDSQEQEKPKEDIVDPVAEIKAPELKDEDVLSYIKNKYNKDIGSVDELFSQREEAESLPEDVSKYLEYKKETGRGFKDFVKVNNDYDDLNDDQILAEYYSLTEEDLDSEDIQYLMEERFSYDEDIDDESEQKKKNIAKKRELSKAKKHLNTLKEKYRTPLESSGNSLSDEELNEITSYREYVQNSKTTTEANQKKSEYFMKKTDEVFNPEFKGFEFNVGDKTVKYSDGDANEMKAKQVNLDNFVGKYTGEDGLINDAYGWHKSISAAMNPDRFAQYFYEQGKADTIGDVSKKSKNINMQVRQTPQAIGDTGFKARQISDESGRGLRIRSKK
tara:strand:- start:190 stop:1281 length:1092 start_codon:yes stop_codon:yes gene_type:complete